jgi:hypothetical protein
VFEKTPVLEQSKRNKFDAFWICEFWKANNLNKIVPQNEPFFGWGLKISTTNATSLSTLIFEFKISQFTLFALVVALQHMIAEKFIYLH